MPACPPTSTALLLDFCCCYGVLCICFCDRPTRPSPWPPSQLATQVSCRRCTVDLLLRTVIHPRCQRVGFVCERCLSLDDEVVLQQQVFSAFNAAILSWAVFYVGTITPASKASQTARLSRLKETERLLQGGGQAQTEASTSESTPTGTLFRLFGEDSRHHNNNKRYFVTSNNNSSTSKPANRTHARLLQSSKKLPLLFRNAK